MPQEVQEHHRQAARIETLVQEVAAFPDPRARATAEELVQALLTMYGEGLARLHHHPQIGDRGGHLQSSSRSRWAPGRRSQRSTTATRHTGYVCSPTAAQGHERPNAAGRWMELGGGTAISP